MDALTQRHVAISTSDATLKLQSKAEPSVSSGVIYRSFRTSSGQEISMQSHKAFDSLI